MVAAACAAGRARASERGFTLDLGLTAGGGYDSNVFMDYEGSTSPGVVASPFLSASPEAALVFESRHAGASFPFSASLRYFTDDAAGLAALWAGRPGLVVRAGAFSLDVAGIVEGYSVSGFSEDDNLMYGGEAAIEVRPSDALGAFIGYEGGLRSFGSRTDADGNALRDTEHRAFAGVLFAPVRVVAIRPGYAYERVTSPDGSLDQGNHEASLKLAFAPSRNATLAPFVRARFKHYDADDRTDRLIQEGLTAAYRFTGWLALAAHYTRTDNLSSVDGLSYARNLGLVTVEFAAPLKLGRDDPVWAEDIPPASLMPRVEGDKVVFRYRAPSAGDVRIIGSFNGWDPAGAAMLRLPDGTWSLALPRTGEDIVYHFLVDGVAAIPQEAPMLSEDGFGGLNGVVPAR
jgi:hypothetical protein